MSQTRTVPSSLAERITGSPASTPTATLVTSCRCPANTCFGALRLGRLDPGLHARVQARQMARVHEALDAQSGGLMNLHDRFEALDRLARPLEDRLDDAGRAAAHLVHAQHGLGLAQLALCQGDGLAAGNRFVGGLVPEQLGGADVLLGGGSASLVLQPDLRVIAVLRLVAALDGRVEVGVGRGNRAFLIAQSSRLNWSSR